MVTLIVGASNDSGIFNDFCSFLISTEDHYDYRDEDTYKADDRVKFIVSDSLRIIELSKSEADMDLLGGMYISMAMGLRTFLKHFKSVSLKDCLQLAYNEIKNRTGKMVNGQFIKDKQ